MEVVPIDFEVADDLAFGRAEEPARSKEEAHTRRQSGCTRIPKYDGTRLRFARDSHLEGTGFEPCMGLFVSSGCFGFVAGSLFGAGKPFFVPSPAVRFAERAEGVKGPKR
jgi:hypothetical protein